MTIGRDQLWSRHRILAPRHRSHTEQNDASIGFGTVVAGGLLDDTLLVVSGEFGRTYWSQDLSGTSPIEKHGREHQQESFCTLLAGGGVKAGLVYGETDDFGYRPVQGQVHLHDLHDLHATILHLLGSDHERLTYPHHGRDYRLTDVFGRVIHDILG